MRERNAYLTPYKCGDLVQASCRASKLINKYPHSKDAAWLYLDRGTIEFANGETKAAIEDYERAIDTMDHYCQKAIDEEIGKVLIQDDVSAWAGDSFEQVLARVYFALALMQQGDFSNAYAILKQAEDIQEAKSGIYASSPLTSHYQLNKNRLAKYLFASLLEKRGDLSNANILYKEAGFCASSLSHQATLLILCHQGNAPTKISVHTDASLASTVALECFLQGPCQPFALSSLGGVPTPFLVIREDDFPSPIAISVNQKPLGFSPICDISEQAMQELDDKLPNIIARGAARYLLRRAAVGAAYQQDPCLGQFVDVAALIANICTQADTRSWATLPYRIDMARLDLPPGCHLLNIDNANYSLNLEQNDLCVINIFNIHPGVTTILVPLKQLERRS